MEAFTSEDPIAILIPTKIMDIHDLNEQAKELRYICDNFDPFVPVKEDIRVLLHKYAISSRAIDPFHTTNYIITLLEDTIAELQRRENKS